MVRSAAHRCVLVLAVALAGFGAACGSPDSTSSDAAGSDAVGATVVTGPPARVGSVGDAIEVAAGAPAKAQDAACTVDRQSLEAASELYLTLNGAVPTSQTDLVDAQLIKEASVRFEITAEGAIVPAPGSPCT